MTCCCCCFSLLAFMIICKLVEMCVNMCEYLFIFPFCSVLMLSSVVVALFVFSNFLLMFFLQHFFYCCFAFCFFLCINCLQLLLPHPFYRCSGNCQITCPPNSCWLLLCAQLFVRVLCSFSSFFVSL